MAKINVYAPDYLRQLCARIFVACGATSADAAVVADELVEASLMGLDSHGVMRVVQYGEDALAGKIKPGAPLRILNETDSTAVIDCGFNFGPVSAVHMVDVVCAKAGRANIACVVSRNCQHVSRLGSYVQKIAERGLFGFATANSSRHGHWVAPWGGSQGRLATNPLAFAAPSSGLPVVMDMSTSMISEGKIRVLMAQGEQLPPDCVQDAQGNPTCDPKAFYGPPKGAILPFGSALGYKGFGLGLLVEILGASLAGQASSHDWPYVNGLCLIAINPEPFCGAARFKEMIDDLCRYMTSTPPAPGYDEVLMPGTREFRLREQRLVEGIPLAETTWHEVRRLAERLNIAMDSPAAGGASS